MVLGSASGLCAATAVFGAVSSSDNCPGVQFAQTLGLSNSSSFSVGTSSVRFTATDAAGGTTDCQFVVEVDDVEAPVIRCPSSTVVNNTPGVCGASVSYGVPTGTDNCPGSSISLTAGLTSGTMFSVGTTTVTFQDKDQALLTSSCSLNVTVIDNEVPKISKLIGFTLVVIY
jgi:hypothetical protein